MVCDDSDVHSGLTTVPEGSHLTSSLRSHAVGGGGSLLARLRAPCWTAAGALGPPCPAPQASRHPRRPLSPRQGT
eukprot:scaffold2190_cov30-Prasinocladus_malaysianus.AAC.4